jgi:tight adherence protein B
MRPVLLIVLSVAAVAALEAIYHVVQFFRHRQRDRLHQRLQVLGVRAEAGVDLLRRGRLSNSPGVDRLLRHFRLSLRLERLLEQADAHVTVARLLVLAAAGAGTGVGAAIVLRLGVPVALLLAALGGALPFVWLLAARERRSRKISEQLPEALDMMARSLRAGHALQGAFKLVATEMAEPINLEFARAFEEQNLGLPFAGAVLKMTERTPSNPDLRIFAVSVIVQAETGGNLVEILEKIAETIRARYRFFGKLRALTAEGRISGLILGALPFGMALFLAVANPEYLRGLIDNPLGRTLLLVGVTSWVVGILWMRSLAKVEP